MGRHETLGDLEGWILFAECEACGHAARLDKAALLDRYGPDRRRDSLPLTCSACGGRARTRLTWGQGRG